MEKINKYLLRIILAITVIAIFAITFTGCDLSGTLKQAASSASQEEDGDKGEISVEETTRRR